MQKVKLEGINGFWKALMPLQKLLIGYLFILVCGSLLLAIPALHNTDISFLDNFFIATSALSTTGLVTVDVGTSYNFAGQLLILILIQLGGIGYMSLGSFVMLARHHKLSSDQEELLSNDYSLPKDLDIQGFVKNVIYFSLGIELVGALLLMPVFFQSDVSNPVWQAIFHSISAFCTAGFSLLSNSFENYRGDVYLNTVISVLSISGAIGFIVFTDFWQRLTNRKSRITLTTQIILRFSVMGLILGTAILFLGEYKFQGYPRWEQLLSAWFQCMTAFTTVGFNTFPIGEMTSGPIFLLLLLMLIGASPSGTGGGIKSTSITAMYALTKSVFKGETKPIYRGKIIPTYRIRIAASNFFFYCMTLAFGIFLLMLTENSPAYDIMFEGFSALGTVGLSRGITGDLSPLGRIIVIILMFMGRIGPLSLGIALFSTSGEDEPEAEEDLAI